METEIENLRQMLKSNEETNLMIAQEIIKGNKDLKNALTSIEVLHELLFSQHPIKIKIATSLLRHNKTIKAQCEARYFPLIEFLGGKSMKLLSNLSKKISEIQMYWKANFRILDWTFEQNFEEHLQSINLHHLCYMRYGHLKKLPTFIFHFNELKSLKINYQNFETVPNIWEAFPNLERIDFKNNQIQFLDEQMADLKELKCMDFSDNRLENFPTTFNLPKLECLNLSNNQLTSLPDSMQYLQKLHELKLEQNHFRKIILNWANLQSLRILTLSKNYLEEFPESLCGLQKLSRLSIANNLLTELPDVFQNMQKLKFLDLQNNNIGKLPDSFKNLSSLKHLDLSRNRLKTLPDFWEHFPNLEVLILNKNYIREIPSSFSKLKKLRHLHFSCNPIQSLHHGATTGSWEETQSFIKRVLEKQEIEHKKNKN